MKIIDLLNIANPANSYKAGDDKLDMITDLVPVIKKAFTNLLESYKVYLIEGYETLSVPTDMLVVDLTNNLLNEDAAKALVATYNSGIKAADLTDIFVLGLLSKVYTVSASTSVTNLYKINVEIKRASKLPVITRDSDIRFYNNLLILVKNFVIDFSVNMDDRSGLMMKMKRVSSLVPKGIHKVSKSWEVTNKELLTDE